MQPMAEFTELNTPLNKVINTLAGIIGSSDFPTGERTSLKRLQPGHPPSLGFYRFFYRHIKGLWAEERYLQDWITLLAGMALMYPSHHQLGRHVGEVLAKNRFAEARLERLLDADRQTQRILLLRTARFLAAKGEPIDWTEVAWLLFASDEVSREKQRRRIARDYYANLPKE